MIAFFLKVQHQKRLTHFGIKGNLAPHYIGLFQIVRRIDNVAYQLELPLKLSQVRYVFRIYAL